MKYKRRVLIPLICYAVALVVYLGVCTAGLLRGSGVGGAAETAIPLEELSLSGFEPRGETPGLFVSTGTDPQIYYEPEAPFRAAGLRFTAQSVNKPGGEMVLYTRGPGDETYSERRKLWAAQAPDGSWYFDLGGEYAGLRFDPDTAGGVLWQVEALSLVHTKPALYYYLPDGPTVAALVLLPAFGAALLAEGGNLVRLARVRRQAQPPGPAAPAAPAKKTKNKKSEE